MTAPLFTLKLKKKPIILGPIQIIVYTNHGMVRMNILCDVPGFTDTWFSPTLTHYSSVRICITQLCGLLQVVLAVRDPIVMPHSVKQ